jgi:hypothetical protein
MVRLFDIKKREYNSLGFKTRRDLSQFIKDHNIRLRHFKTFEQFRTRIEMQQRDNKENTRDLKDIVALAQLNDGVEITKPELRLVILNYQNIPDTYAIIKIGNVTYTLNNTFKNKILKILDNVEVVADNGSDAEVMNYIISNDDEQMILFIISTRHIGEGKKRNRSPRDGGSFFKYFLTYDKVDLSRYDIYHEMNLENYKDNCLIKALRAGGVDDQQLSSVKHYINDRRVRMADIKLIARDLNIMIKLHQVRYGKTKLLKYGKNGDRVIEVALIEHHYFLYEKTQYTIFSIRHYNEIKDFPNWNTARYMANGKIFQNGHSFCDSLSIVKELLKIDGAFIPIDLTLKLQATQYYDKQTEENKILNLDVRSSQCLNYNVRNTFQDPFDIIYFDCETTTDGNIHRPYLICAVYRGKDDKKIYKGDKFS